MELIKCYIPAYILKEYAFVKDKKHRRFDENNKRIENMQMGDEYEGETATLPWTCGIYDYYPNDHGRYEKWKHSRIKHL